MNREGLSLKFEDISDVLGVLVGHIFNHKIEMHLVGFHRQVQASIAYRQLGGELLITNIVASCITNRRDSRLIICEQMLNLPRCLYSKI
jgi:hypothetical protein